MNINEKNLDNENISEMTESSQLTERKNKTTIKSNTNSLVNKYKANIICIIIISFILMIILYIILRAQLIQINISKFQNKKIDSNIYSDKWIVMATNKSPNSYFDKLIKLTKNDTRKILVIEKGEKNEEKLWEKYLKEKNIINKVIYLSLDTQNKLGYKTVECIPKNSYARKNMGYLYAIEHGAKEILDTDDNILLDNSFLSMQLSFHRLYYVNNVSQMVNPYMFYGRPDIWPRGFKYKDIILNNTNDFFMSKANRFLSEPLIYTGILKIPDVDSIFLKTKENIFSKKKIIKFHKTYSLLYIPGNYVPVNSKNTLFKYDAFPALALPVSVQKRVCDIWRGYLAQRYIWGYKGFVMYRNSNANSKQIDNNINSTLEQEKDLYFKLEKFLECLNKDINNIDEKKMENPGVFFIKLIETLVENNILEENDLKMYKSFLYDLESFGFKYKNNYTIEINSDVNNYINNNSKFQFYVPSIPYIDLFTKMNSNITLLNHYNTRKIYDDILLIVNYNYAFLSSLNNYLYSLYSPNFPNMIFVIPGKKINKTLNQPTLYNMINCPESHKGYYSYYCLKRIYEKYPSYRGYLFVMDDAFIKVWELENLNLSIPWILTFFHAKTKYWPEDYDREELLLEKHDNWKKNAEIFFNGNITGNGVSDFFYLPNYFAKEFIKISKEFYNSTVFIELTVPSIYGIILEPMYQYIHFIALWGKDRKKWKNYLYKAHRQIIIHPIKFSDINNQNEVIRYLYCKKANGY